MNLLTLSKSHQTLPSYTAFGQGPKDDHVPTRKIIRTCETTYLLLWKRSLYCDSPHWSRMDGGNLNDSRALQVANQSRENQTFFFLFFLWKGKERNKMNKYVFETKKNLFFNRTLILGLAGMELTFFTAAQRVPCFRFVTKTALMTHQCFG